MSAILPDVIEPGLRVVFCGTAVGSKSATAGAYYAGPGNQFWPVLHKTGLTPRRLEPREYLQLLQFGIGLTDVCKTRSGSDNAIGHGGFDVAGLLATLEEFSPETLAFNGKKAAQIVLGHPISYGPQHERLARANVFVVPSTSGAARGFWDLRYWQELADSVRSGS